MLSSIKNSLQSSPAHSKAITAATDVAIFSSETNPLEIDQGTRLQRRNRPGSPCAAFIFLRVTTTRPSYLTVVDTRYVSISFSGLHVDRVYRFHTRRIGIILDRFAAAERATIHPDAPASRLRASASARLRRERLFASALLHAGLCVINAREQRTLAAMIP